MASAARKLTNKKSKSQVVKKKFAKKTKKKVVKLKLAKKPKAKDLLGLPEDCCVGCKIDGFLADLVKSDHGNDRIIGYRFQEALDEFNREQEERNNPTYKPC